MRELDENEKFVEEFATSGYSCSLGRDNAYFYEWLIPHEQWTDVHYLETVAALYLETVIGCVQAACSAHQTLQGGTARTSRVHFIYLYTRAVSTSQLLAVIIR